MMSEADQIASSISNTSASSANTLHPRNVVNLGVRMITITKDETNGFGFNIVGGTDGPYIPGHDGIFICHVRNAELEGQINAGDRIISVNDTSMDAITHDEAVELLKKLQGQCVFTIEANAERSIAMGFDSIHERNTIESTIQTGPSQSQASTLNASHHSIPTGNVAHRYPSQLTEIAVVVVGAVALSLIAYIGYNRINEGTWWK